MAEAYENMPENPELNREIENVKAQVNQLLNDYQQVREVGRQMIEHLTNTLQNDYPDEFVTVEQADSFGVDFKLLHVPVKVRAVSVVKGLLEDKPGSALITKVFVYEKGELHTVEKMTLPFYADGSNKAKVPVAFIGHAYISRLMTIFSKETVAGDMSELD